MKQKLLFLLLTFCCTFFVQQKAKSQTLAAGDIALTGFNTACSLTVYNVTGGGQFCQGGSGVSIGLSDSDIGVSYQLYLGANPSGSAVNGTGNPISFGNRTTAGTYTVVASDGGSCQQNMSGNAVITVNPLPTITLGTSPTVMQGSTSASLPYTATSNSPVTYTITWSATSLAAGFTNISTPQALPASPISITVPASAPANTYVAAIRVQNATCNSTSTIFTVTVSNTPPAPAITVQPIQQTVCPGTSVNYTATATNATTYWWQASTDNANWFYLNPAYGNATGIQTNSLTIINASMLSGYYFRLEATGPTSPPAYSNSVRNLIANISGTTVVTNVACNGGNTGAINLTPTGGTAPYTYNWGGGVTTEDRTNLAAGNYSVTITDANNCTGTVNVTVNQPASAISGSTVVTNIACNGSSTGAINLTPTGGTAPYTYNWGGGVTTEDRTNLAAGNYSVTITDANGCTGEVNVIVSEPDAINAAAVLDSNVTCTGNDGAVTANVTGGTAPYGYLWDNGAVTASVTGLSAGTYTVVVTDANGCTDTDSVTITPATGCATVATVTTDAVTAYTPQSFTVGGNITDDGGAQVTDRGIVYGTAANPTTADNIVQIGTGEGMFSQSVSGLTPGETYYIRAYAINSQGTAYGNQVVFTMPYGIINLVHNTITTQYPTIQQAVDASVTGDIVMLGSGTYIEQVTVTTGITIQGAGTSQTIVRSPLAADLSINGGWKTLKAQDVIAVIGVKTNDDSQVVIKDLTVDGFDQGYLPDAVYPDKNAYAFQGISALNTNLLVDNVAVTRVRELATDFGAVLPAGYLPADQPSGMNHNEAIFAESAVGAGNHTLEVRNSYIDKFQKTAILVWGPTLDVNIHDNTIQGYGQTLYSTGNGIQISSTDRTSLGGNNGDRRGTTGIITNNQILGIGIVIPEPGQDGSYLNLGLAGPSAILPYMAGNGLIISNNTITRAPYQSWYNDYISNDGGFSNAGIAVFNSNNATVTGNTISGFDVAITEFGAMNGSQFFAEGNIVSNNRNDYFTAQNNDHIILGASEETLSYYDNSAGVDLIDNFGIGDRINVIGFGPGSINGELAGNLIVDFTTGTVTEGDGTNVAARSVQVQQNAGNTYLFIDTDATAGAAELKLQLSGLYVPANFKLDGGFIVYSVAPPVALDQEFCNEATVADLAATGTGLKWYDVPTGGTALQDNTALVTGTYYVSQTVSGEESDRTEIDVTINTAPVATISNATNVLCNGTATGAATVDVTGGTAPYTYAWSNNAITASATGLAAGTYTVTVTDAKGCTAAASVTITDPAALVASAASQTNITCNGGANGSASVAVTGGTGPYTYSWSPSGGTAATATGLTAGTYTVTVTDANGCEDMQSFTITQPAALVASAAVTTEISCNNAEDGAITVTPAGGTAPYTYALTGAGSGAATTVVSQGFEATGSWNYTIAPAVYNTEGNPVVGGSEDVWNIIEAFSGNINAASEGTHFFGIQDINNSNGGGNFDHTISFEPVDVSAIGDLTLSFDYYTIGFEAADVLGYVIELDNGTTWGPTVELNRNTTAWTTVSVNIPASANFVRLRLIASQDGATDYAGFDNIVLSADADPQGPVFTGIGAGTYDVTVTDANGCTATASVTITEPTALSVSSVATNASCNGGSNGAVDLTVTGGTAPYTFVWSNAATTEDLTGLAAGTYDITVTDANGCTATASVTIAEPTALSASGVVTNASCNGGSNGTVNLTVTGGTAPYTFVWSNAATTEDLTGLAAGTYTVTVADANGCEDTQSFTITQPAALVASAASQTNISCNGGANGSASVAVTGGTGPYTYSWAPSGGTAATATGLTAGTYTVTVTDANGCEATQSFTITQPAAIVITAQPEDEIISTGNDAIFAVTASNADSYQWQMSTNGTDWNDVADGNTNPVFTGTMTNVLTLTGVPASFDGYSFRVIVTNGSNCDTTSDEAMLMVNNLLVAVDDDFSTATINEGAGGIAGDVTANDLFNGIAVVDTDVTISIVNDGGLTGVSIDADGNLIVPASALEGTYTVIYSMCENASATNCSQAEVIVVVQPPLSIRDIKGLSVKLYPNPAVMEVFVNIDDISGYRNPKVTIWDLNGRKVSEHALTSELQAINISTLEAGVYLFDITSDRGKTTRKVIKNK